MQFLTILFSSYWLLFIILLPGQGNDVQGNGSADQNNSSYDHCADRIGNSGKITRINTVAYFKELKQERQGAEGEACNTIAVCLFAGYGKTSEGAGNDTQYYTADIAYHSGL